MKISNADLIKELSERSGLPQTQVRTFLKDYHDIVMDHVSAGDSVSVANWGIYSLKISAARAGVNPRTKEAIQIPESKRLAFAPAKRIKEALNQ